MTGDLGFDGFWHKEMTICPSFGIPWVVFSRLSAANLGRVNTSARGLSLSAGWQGLSLSAGWQGLSLSAGWQGLSVSWLAIGQLAGSSGCQLAINW